MIPRKMCEVCGMPSRDSICDVCYPLVRAQQESEGPRQWPCDTWEMDRGALIRRTADAKN